MRNCTDLTGKTFHWLTVIKRVPNIKKDVAWECLCKCGETTTALAYKLLDGRRKSCGCLAQMGTQNNLSEKFSREYKSFIHAKDRCNNRRNERFNYYGGRGIEFRFSSFAEFLDALGQRPSILHTLERKNTNGHYEPENVRWATKKEQGRNKRNNHLITAEGKTLCISEWAETTGISEQCIAGRLKNRWCKPCAVTQLLNGNCTHKVRN